MQKIFDEASFSVVSNSKNKKTAAGRKCPLCERRMGNFGPNYKNHVKKCCPVRAFLRLIDFFKEFFLSLPSLQFIFFCHKTSFACSF